MDWQEMIERIDNYAAAHNVPEGITRRIDWWLMDVLRKAEEFDRVARELGLPVKALVVVVPTTPDGWERVSEEQR